MSVKPPTLSASPDDDESSPGTSPTARRVRNPHGQGGRLRGELIAAADRILAQTGDAEALSLRGVAREVGVATPSIYLHFPDKRALVLAVLAERFKQLSAAVRAAVSAEAGPADQLRAGCLAYCQFATEHPNAYRVLFGRQPPPVSTANPERAVSAADASAPPSDRGKVEAPGPDLIPLRADLAMRRTDDAPELVTMETPATEVTPPRIPVGAEAFMFLVEGAAACMKAGLAPPGDPLRVAIGIWTALHGIVSLRASLPQFPWPPLQQQVDDALHGLVGLRHSSVTADAATPE